MNAADETTRSLWLGESAEAIRDLAAPCLSGDMEVDVVVVGAGIAGLSVAYELAGEGRSVVVLDRGSIAGGMTGRTTAHLSSELDDRYSDLLDLRRIEDATAYRASQEAAIDRIEAIAATEGIACDFARIDGYLFEPPGERTEVLDREKAACEQVGLDGVTFVDRAPIPGLDTGRALRFPRQARFDPIAYCAGLVRALSARGVRIHADTTVEGVDEANGIVTVATASGHAVKARYAIFCTNSPVNDHLAIHSKQAPYRTYAIACEIPSDGVVDALYWDTPDPYHYVRITTGRNGASWLIVGGEDHKTGLAGAEDAPFDALEAWTRERWPRAGRVAYRWSGQVMEPVDGLPFAGVNPGNSRVYVVTGDSGQGMTNGVAGALIIRDLILFGRNPWAEVTAPGRITVRAAADFVSENMTVAKNFAERLLGGERRDPESLAPGEALLLRKDGKPLAAYRDPSGTLHLRSAVCTHAGCIVHWNPVETCWECPCHGSHFDPQGRVLNGPALSPLADWKS